MDGAKIRGERLGIDVETIDEILLRKYTPDEKSEIEKLDREIKALQGRARANVSEIESSRADYKTTAAYLTYKEIKATATGKQGIAPTVLQSGKIEAAETRLAKFDTDITQVKLTFSEKILAKEKDKKHTQNLFCARIVEDYLDCVVERRRLAAKEALQAPSGPKSKETNIVVDIHTVPEGTEQPTLTGAVGGKPASPSPLTTPTGSELLTHPKFAVGGGEDEVGQDIPPNPPKPPNPLQPPTPKSSEEGNPTGLSAEEKERIFAEEVLRKEYLRDFRNSVPALDNQGERISELSGRYIASGLTKEEFSELRDYWVKYITQLSTFDSLVIRLGISELRLGIPEADRTQTEIRSILEPDWGILKSLIKEAEDSDSDNDLTDEELAAMADGKMRKSLSQVMGSVSKYGGTTGDDPNGHLQCFKIHFRIVTGVDVMLPLIQEHDKKWSPEIIDSFECTLWSHAKQWFKQYTTLTRDEKTPKKWEEIRKDFVKNFSLYGKTDVEKEMKLGEITWDYTKVPLQDFLLNFRTMMGTGDEEIPALRQLSLFIKAMPAKIFNQFLLHVTDLAGAIDAVTKAISMKCVDLNELAKESTAKVGSKDGDGKAAVPFMSATSVPPNEAKGLKKSMQTMEQSLMKKIEDVMFVGAVSQANQNRDKGKGRGKGQGGQGQGQGGNFQGGQTGNQPGYQNQQQGGGFWGNSNPGWNNSGQNWNNPGQGWSNPNQGWGGQGQSWGGSGQGWDNQSQGWGGQQGGGWGGKRRGGGGGWRGPPRGRGRGGPPRGPPTNPGMDLSKVQCWTCGRMGHTARYCRSGDGVDGQASPQRYPKQGTTQPKVTPEGGGVNINAKDLAQVIKDMVKDKNGSLNP